MANLFTTFESVSPPEIVSPEAKQVYQETQAYTMPSNLEDNTNWNFLEDSNEFLDPIKFEYTESKEKEESPAQKVINTAKSFIGSKYSWGGSNPSTGFDCSGLMQYAFKQAGIDIPRTAAQQGKVGQEINLQQAQPGDMIWFGSKQSPSGQHIGLISRIDNGQIYIIDAAGKKLGIVERALPNLQIKSVRRIFGNTLGGNFQQSTLAFFKNKGLTDSQAKGIVGNLMQESRGNHTVTNKSSGAFGLAQWVGPRKERLIQRYGPNPTVQQQLEFIWEELNTTENKAFQKLLNTNTVADATRAFANHFERAGKGEMNMNQRINFAYQA